jgi:acetyl esterase/lipase
MIDRPQPSARWKLPSLRESDYPTPVDLTNRRQAGRGLLGPALGAAVTVEEATVGGVPCVICNPPDPSGSAVYFHGGGYRLGSAANSAAFASRLASATARTVIVVDYQLAPEHPFPAGLTDAAAVYEHVLAESEPPFLIGDSAGGGLAAALTVVAAQSGFPAPAALILMSPWLDLSCRAGTFVSRAETDQLFSLASAQEAAAMYLQGHDPADPLVSPLLADLGGWPPALLMASTEEVLLQDSIAFAGVLVLAGNDLTCWFRRGVPHAWPAVFPDLPETTMALAAVETFVEGLSVVPQDGPVGRLRS